MIPRDIKGIEDINGDFNLKIPELPSSEDEKPAGYIKSSHAGPCGAKPLFRPRLGSLKIAQLQIRKYKEDIKIAHPISRCAVKTFYSGIVAFSLSAL